MTGRPKSLHALQIALLFKRRPATRWSEKEIRAISKLNKAHCFDSLEDLAMVERYYFFERKKGDKGIHRRDLYTFLNNYHGEVDRARAWAATHRGLSKPKKAFVPPAADTRTDEELAQSRDYAREQTKKLRSQLFGGGAA